LQTVLKKHTERQVWTLETEDYGWEIIDPSHPDLIPAPLEEDVQKHQEHDQKTHGSWATGGNGLGIKEVIRLHKSSDPLARKIYAAEQSFDARFPEEQPLHPTREAGESAEDYDKRYKEYTEKHKEWAINQHRNIVTKTGERLLDGSPEGVKKYVEEIIGQDWFIEAFGDGSSLPPLTVAVKADVGAGRHRLQTVTDGADNIITATNEISVDEQVVKDERVILHEIAHYATAISLTKPYEGHGVEFAKTHLFIVEKAAGSERAAKLRTAYKERGIEVGD